MLKHNEIRGLDVCGTQVMKHKAVQEEMTEAKALVDKLKAEDEKAERRAAKSARKAGRKVGIARHGVYVWLEQGRKCARG